MMNSNFLKVLENKSASPIYILDKKYKVSDYIPIDLSVNNTELEKINVSKSHEIEDYVFSYINNNHAKVAYGGYFEERGIYNRSSLFSELAVHEHRNMHIGLDLWAPAHTSVLVPLDGKIHSYAINEGLGNYGPTIILEHIIAGETFYTLYGHLSFESLKNKEIGMQLKAGEEFAYLGTPEVNGDYAPHLHFQIIKKLDGYKRDYPGVARKNDLAYYKENCPDPNLLLKIYQE
ncbi:peptidoglycan DD-metalloendopeptidase family protein [Zhouia sp. PK063]|uniref:peptidoglycan DD-metalloendopeptidase family protein n=1 Tax=Zhouia sp. PK063 TaxID=3373602 RepID=UPI0037AFD94D